MQLIVLKSYSQLSPMRNLYFLEEKKDERNMKKTQRIEAKTKFETKKLNLS